VSMVGGWGKDVDAETEVVSVGGGKCEGVLNIIT